MADPNLYMQFGKAGFDTTYAGVSTLGQYSVNRIMARSAAEMYRSQARLALLQAQRQQGYINEESSQAVWNVADKYYNANSSAIAYMGASGLAISSGDRRLLNGMLYGANEEATGINRTAYLQSFETYLQARLEASRLEYAAKSAEAIAKRSSPKKAFIAANFAALGAFGSNLGGLAQAGAFGKAGSANNVSPVMDNNSSSMVGGDSGSFSYVGKMSPWGSIY